MPDTLSPQPSTWPPNNPPCAGHFLQAACESQQILIAHEIDHALEIERMVALRRVARPGIVDLIGPDPTRSSNSDLTMGYFSVDGLVSGIKSHMIEAPSRATAAIVRNVVVRPKFAAIRPKTAVLSAAPIPAAVPMMP